MNNNINDKKVPNVPNLRFPEFTDEWRKYRMIKCCTFAKGHGIAKDNLSVKGNPCILYGELYTTYKTAIARNIRSKTELNSKTLFRSKINDVIIPCSGETAKDIATSVSIPYNDVLLGGDLTVIRSTLDGAFLSNQLNGVRKFDIARIAQGKSIVHLQADELKKVEISFPTIIEQQKISGFIDLLDRRIETQNKIIEKYKSLIKGISNKLFSKNKSHLITIKQCVACNSSSLSSNSVTYVSDGFPVYGASGFVGFSAQYDICGESILIIKDGASVGNVQFVYGKYSVIGTLNYFTEKTNNTLKYLYFFLQNMDFTKYIVGSGIPHIYFKDYGSVMIPFPTTEERMRIVSLLSGIEDKIAIEYQLADLYHKQKVAMLRTLFI